MIFIVVLGQTKFRSHSIKSGIILVLGQTEISWKFHRVSNRCFESDRDSANVPEFLESVLWHRLRFCACSRNSGFHVSDHTEILFVFLKFWNIVTIGQTGILWKFHKFGIGALRHTEILWTFQKFWNRCIGPDRDFVEVPKTLELMYRIIQKFCWGYRILESSLLWVRQRFCARTRNSGILVFWPDRDFVENPEFLESVFWIRQEIPWTFQKFWNRCFGPDRNFVDVPEILNSVFWLRQSFCGRVPEILESLPLYRLRFCGRSRISGIVV